MSDELTQAPRIEGETWVFPDGRRLPRVRGAEAQPEAPEETPADDAAPEGTPAPDPEYTPERARGLHAELTKAQQDLAAARTERELIQRAQQGDLEAMRELNLPLDFGDAEDPEEDPALQDPRVDALIQEREQERQLQEQQAGWNQFNTDLDKVAKGKELSPRDRALIYSETLQAGGTPEALSGVFDEFQKERDAYDKAVIQAYVGSKRAPHVSPGGTGATEEVLPSDAKHRDRVAWMTERLRLANEQQ